MKKATKLLSILFLLLLPLLATGACIVWIEKNIQPNISILDKDKNEKKFNEIEKGDFIQVEFNSSVDKKSVEKNLKISPEIEARQFWLNSKVLRLEIKKPLKPETKYIAEINRFKSRLGLDLQKPEKINFSAPSVPELKSFFPENGKKQVDYTLEPEIILNKSLPEGYFLNFEIEPYVKIDYEINSNKKKIVFKPEKELLANTKYEVKINLKNNFYNDFDRLLYQGEFVTKKPSPVVYNFNENGEPLKTEERFVLPKPKIIEGKYIDIDLSNQYLSIFQDGKELGVYKVSTGKIGMDTPVGEFEVMGKASRPWSKEYELFMPWFIQFTSQGHGIHELPEWPGGIKEGFDHLGFPVSHGCARLGVGPAKKVYDFAEIGTPIIIY
ncbi:MAG: L,D-transpeptidase family protein [Candidatus Moraniibacteriota bacterium]